MQQWCFPFSAPFQWGAFLWVLMSEQPEQFEDEYAEDGVDMADRAFEYDAPRDFDAPE